MDTQKLIKKLEGIARERKPQPQYTEGFNPQYSDNFDPQFDEKLLKVHYLLARLYSRGDDIEDEIQALAHFRGADVEFFIMCKVETQQLHYTKEQKENIERKLERYKVKLGNLAEKIGYDNTDMLLLAPTSFDSRKNPIILS